MSLDWVRDPSPATLGAFVARSESLRAFGIGYAAFERIARCYEAPFLAKLRRFLDRVDQRPPLLYAKLLAELHSFCADPLSYSASDLLARDESQLSDEHLSYFKRGQWGDELLERLLEASPRRPVSAPYEFHWLSREFAPYRAELQEVLSQAEEVGLVVRVEEMRAAAMVVAASALQAAEMGGKQSASYQSAEIEADKRLSEYGQMEFDDLVYEFASRILAIGPKPSLLLSEAVQASDESDPFAFARRTEEGLPRVYFYWNLGARFYADNGLARRDVAEGARALVEGLFARCPFIVSAWKDLLAASPELAPQLVDFVAAAKSVAALESFLEEGKREEELAAADALREREERYAAALRKWEAGGKATAKPRKPKLKNPKAGATFGKRVKRALLEEIGLSAQRWATRLQHRELFPKVWWSMLPLKKGAHKGAKMSSSMQTVLLRGKLRAMLRSGFDRQALWNSDVDIADVMLLNEAIEEEDEGDVPERPKKKAAAAKKRPAQPPSESAHAELVKAQLLRSLSEIVEDTDTTSVKGVWLCGIMSIAVLGWFEKTIVESHGRVVQFMRESALETRTETDILQRLFQFDAEVSRFITFKGSAQDEGTVAYPIQLAEDSFDYLAAMLDFALAGSEEIPEAYRSQQIFWGQDEFSSDGDKRTKASKDRAEGAWARFEGYGKGAGDPSAPTYGISILSGGPFLGYRWADQISEFKAKYAGGNPDEALERIESELIQGFSAASGKRFKLPPADRKAYLKLVREIVFGRMRAAADRIASALIRGAWIASFYAQYAKYASKKRVAHSSGLRTFDDLRKALGKTGRSIASDIASNWKRMAGLPDEDGDETEGESDEPPESTGEEEEYNEEEDEDYGGEEAEEDEDDEEEEEEDDDDDEEGKETSEEGKETSEEGEEATEEESAPKKKKKKKKAARSLEETQLIKKLGGSAVAKDLSNFSIIERSPTWFTDEPAKAVWSAAGFVPEASDTAWRVSAELRFRTAEADEDGRSPIEGFVSFAQIDADEGTDYRADKIELAGKASAASVEQVLELLAGSGGWTESGGAWSKKQDEESLAGRAWHVDYALVPPLFFRYLFSPPTPPSF